MGLNEPGEYAVLVDFDKGAGRGQVRIPLRVAQSGWLPTMIIGPLIGVLLLAALVTAWLLYRRYCKDRDLSNALCVNIMRGSLPATTRS